MRNAAVRDHGKTRSAAERDHWTLSELRDWRRNVGATSLLDLDLHPNVAGFGTLHRYGPTPPGVSQRLGMLR